MLQMLELYGGIGSPRIALRNLGIPVKAIDYVEIDQDAVNSYNAMFAEDLPYKTQSVVTWNLRPDAAIHGSPCQDNSIIGGRAGMIAGSGTRSSLLFKSVEVFENMGVWRPKIVIWENVPGVLTVKKSKGAFQKYLECMEALGYTNAVEILDAREFGLPQARKRIFTISIQGRRFDFSKLKRTAMKHISEYLQDNAEVSEAYTVTQPSILAAIGKKGLRRATVIEDFAYTITTRQDRSPAQIIDCGDRYRYLTELECWRLQGYSDEDFFKAAAVHERRGRFKMPLYKQSGNSIPVPKFEAIFEALL